MHGAPAFLFSNACSTVRPVSPVSQLSLFSAAARPPRPGDLAGLLCGPGQIVRFGSGDTARLSVVLADPRRAPVVVATCTAVGIDAEPVVTESGATAVRTAFRRDLVGLAHAWTRRGEEAGACRGTGADEPGSPASSLREAVKTVPAGMLLDGAVLRVWMLAAGRWDGRGVDLLLDPHAPQTHLALIAAATRAGISPARSGRGAALRITGARRIRRLLELVGPAPGGIGPDEWPEAGVPRAVDGAVTLPSVPPATRGV
jgi:hypothetical protein